jgi:amino acid transporter
MGMEKSLTTSEFLFLLLCFNLETAASVPLFFFFFHISCWETAISVPSFLFLLSYFLFGNGNSRRRNKKEERKNIKEKYRKKRHFPVRNCRFFLVVCAGLEPATPSM